MMKCVINYLSLMLLAMSLIGCQQLKENFAPNRYVEPTADQPRARVLLVSDFGNSLFSGYVDFYKEMGSYRESIKYYLSKATFGFNRPSTKDLGMKVNLAGKHFISQVYLPADKHEEISARGESFSGVCTVHLGLDLKPNQDYVLSMNRVNVGGSKYCLLQLYKVNEQGELELIEK